jgi:hypothetical protein
MYCVENLRHCPYQRLLNVVLRYRAFRGYARFAETFIAGFAEPIRIRCMLDGTEAYVCDRCWNAVYRLELERRQLREGAHRSAL